VLDAALADMCGFELQARLASEWPHVAIVFVAADASSAMAVRAIKAGAVDFLTLPLDDSELLRAVDEAVAHSDGVLRRDAEMRALGNSYASMSCRERQVMALVTTGLLNKQVGGKLGISEITVKAHRGQVMRKMNARSFPDLVNKAARLKLHLKPLREWGCGWTGATLSVQDRMSLPPRRNTAIDGDLPAELPRFAMPTGRGDQPRLVACSETNPGA
jgi:FixJ family two-component response regulator